jgi:2-keto-3-deoxy-L-rhamnonate aldolase
MSAAPPPHGIFVPVPTFFAQKTDTNYCPVSPPLDTDTQVAHGVFLAKAGIRGLVLLGSTGEAVHIRRTERKTLIHAVREGLANAGFPNYPLMAGTATNSVEETVELLTESHEAGADFGLVLAPGFFGNAVNQEGVVAWYQTVADRSPMPILMQVFPFLSSGMRC